MVRILLFMQSALAVFFVVVLAACARGHIAMVNGDPISRADFEQALRIEVMKYDPIVWRDPGRLQALKEQLLDRLVGERFLIHEAKKVGIHPTEAELAEAYDQYKGQYTEAAFQEMLRAKGISYDAWKDFRRNRYLVDRLAERRLGEMPAVAPAAVDQYYREHRAEFVEPESVRVRQIVTETEATARDLRERILKGANFAQLAVEYSLTPDGKAGGDLGYIPRGSFPRIFDEVCFRLPVGAMSDVITSEYGYHLFKVLDRKPARVIPLAEARQAIEARLREETAMETYEKWVAELRATAKVSINHDALRQVRIKETMP